MREILFRGKRKYNGKWCYGSLQCFKGFSIFDNDYKSFFTVNSTTVGQYTGLTDKNGKKIFEGDIVKHYNNSDDGFDIGALYWDETFSQWKRTSIGNFHHSSFTYVMSHSCEYEVIGNIHDNPELLKGGDEE